MLTNLGNRITLFRYASHKNNNLVRFTVATLFFVVSLLAIVFGLYGIKVYEGEDKRSSSEVFADATWRVHGIGAQILISIAAAMSLFIFWSMRLGRLQPKGNFTLNQDTPRVLMGDRQFKWPGQVVNPRYD